jgi:hypothetical protein
MSLTEPAGLRSVLARAEAQARNTTPTATSSRFPVSGFSTDRVTRMAQAEVNGSNAPEVNRSGVSHKVRKEERQLFAVSETFHVPLGGSSKVAAPLTASPLPQISSPAVGTEPSAHHLPQNLLRYRSALPPKILTLSRGTRITRAGKPASSPSRVRTRSPMKKWV